MHTECNLFYQLTYDLQLHHTDTDILHPNVVYLNQLSFSTVSFFHTNTGLGMYYISHCNYHSTTQKIFKYILYIYVF
jgi:hypothetical protein